MHLYVLDGYTSVNLYVSENLNSFIFLPSVLLSDVTFYVVLTFPTLHLCFYFSSPVFNPWRKAETLKTSPSSPCTYNVKKKMLQETFPGPWSSDLTRSLFWEWNLTIGKNNQLDALCTLSGSLTQERPRARFHAENFSEVLDVEINPGEEGWS